MYNNNKFKTILQRKFELVPILTTDNTAFDFYE